MGSLISGSPKYYLDFRDRVLAGEIPVCKTISMEMNRIDKLIDDPDMFFFEEPVEAFINFVEGELTKTDGSKLQVLDSFKLWSEQLFGWYYLATRKKFVWSPKGGEFIDEVYLKRLINKQYLIVARGSAKSMYASFIQAYFLVMDGETTHQVTTAPTMKQAQEVMSPIRTAITRAHGPWFKFLTEPTLYRPDNKTGLGARPLLLSTKKGIESGITGSILEVRPMSIAKLQGLRPKIVTVDEWLSTDIREDVIGSLEQGASKLDDYIIVATSSEGTVRNGAGDNIKIELMKILSGEYDDPHTSIFYYRLDDVEEVGDPSSWIKANPNIGITVSYEAYSKDVKRAQSIPSTRNDILAKRFNLPMEGYTYFFTYEETIPHRYVKDRFRNVLCSLGGDMSQGDDFCSFMFLFYLGNNRFGAESINFITERTLELLDPAMRVQYELFINERSLFYLKGSVLDMQEVYYYVEEEMVSRGFDPTTFGYDPYNASLFVKLYTENYGPYNIEVVRQGVRTETVPLGEIKKLTEDRALIFDQEIISFSMGNAMVLEDNNGNRKLYKRRYENKVDPIAALMDAYVAYTRHRDEFE